MCEYQLESECVYGVSVHGYIECVCRGVLMGIYDWIDKYVCVCLFVSIDAWNACVMVYRVCENACVEAVWVHQRCVQRCIDCACVLVYGFCIGVWNVCEWVCGMCMCVCVCACVWVY